MDNQAVSEVVCLVSVGVDGCWLRTTFDSGRELVALAWNCDHNTIRAICGGSRSESFAQKENVLREIALFNEGVWPDGGEQLLLGNYAMRMFSEVSEEIESLGSKRDMHPVQLEGASGGVEFKPLESN